MSLRVSDQLPPLSFGMWNYHVVASATHTVVVRGARDLEELAKVARWRMADAEHPVGELTIMGQVREREALTMSLPELGVPEQGIIDALQAIRQRGHDAWTRGRVQDDASVTFPADAAPRISVVAEFDPLAVLSELANQFEPVPHLRRAPVADAPVQPPAIGGSTTEKLELIRTLLVQAEQAWASIPRDEQDRLSEESDLVEEASLRHVLLKGESAAEAAIEAEAALRERIQP